MRDIEAIDSELRLAAGEQGEPLPSIVVADALLDERREMIRRGPRYPVLSTTVARPLGLVPVVAFNRDQAPSWRAGRRPCLRRCSWAALNFPRTCATPMEMTVH
jgi:hypothetical protein